MAKGQPLEVKGSICNVPIANIEINSIVLPQLADTNGIIVKLKRKTDYRGFVLF